MSLKQQMHHAIDEMPEPRTLEEAVECLYHAFRMKHGGYRAIKLAGVLGGDASASISGDPIADVLAELRHERSEQLENLAAHAGTSLP